MTIMLIGAHPDDEISAGGTLAKHAHAGDRVVVLTMTHGGMGHRTTPTHELVHVRERELKAAVETLGAELRLLDYQDGSVPVNKTVGHELAWHIRDVRPDILLTHSRETLHPDHNATAANVIEAYFAASLPLLDLDLEAWAVPRVLLFAHDLYRRHDVYVDIRDTMDIKIAAAECHASQYGEWLAGGGSAVDGGWNMEWRDAFRTEARLFGGHCGIEYAEAFDDLERPGPVALERLDTGQRA